MSASWARGRVLAIAAGAVAVAAVAIAVGSRRVVVAADLARARDLHGAAFAGAAACARCHAEHAASWRRTFHRTMTGDVSPARPETVAGDFSGASYRYGGVAARMHRDAAGRFMMTFSPDAHAPEASDVVDAVVVRSVGSRRYQQYLADVDGVLWRLPIAYHVEEKRWFHMNGAFLTPDPIARENGGPAEVAAGEPAPGRPRFGGGAFDRHVTRWNDNCVFCHNVGPNPGRDPTTGAFRTSVAELGVACESCHGPGAEHVQVNQDPVRRYVLHLSGVADPTIVNPSRLSPGRAADVCGRCHGQRISDDVAPVLAHGDPFVPGDDLGLYSSPLWRDTPLAGSNGVFAARFWDDGTPRLTAYEYQGLLQSRCASHGALTCTTCHGMHEGDPRGQIREAAAGDAACLTCHARLGAPSEIARHTRHEPTGPGARCVGCHMPRIVYGVLDAHPSHRIEIPEPARAVATGRPDACTSCHVESDRAWAIRHRERLWPRRAGLAAPGQTPGQAPAQGEGPAGAMDDDAGAPKDALFGGDPVTRVLAADAIGRAPWPSVPAEREQAERRRIGALLEAMAGDRYPAVRHLAARALDRVLRARDRSVAASHARAFDATAPARDRGRVTGDLRTLLSVPAPRGTEAERITSLRAAARLVDIDIGE